MSDTVRPSLDRDNPWPGLVPFDESDHAFFHGRDAEAVELLRLVRREPLTVLFGRSGLGKTSLLKAGLFPSLRGEDFLPAYVRLDHSGTAPPLREQVLRDLRAACDAAGVQAAQAAMEEGLWSFFHRRDAEFWSALNRPVTPVIVFDQFEEIFTVGQDGEAARSRAAGFLVEMADLVENRPPPTVRQALELDPAAASRYEFRRATVKLVLSFREDFLAEMEGLKRSMPSVMVNRLRLLPMDGAQANAVVTESGGALVDDDVARRILRLAWKNEPAPPVEPAEFAHIEIDPALLSVVCSELNQKRRQTVPPLPQITPALLAGADREILAGFYERSMGGLDTRVRAFVENELITDRGFRDSHDWDDALALPGVSRDALDALIARRLLRVDDRQGLRRLELTHDVLTRVVMESRDRRRAREVEEATQARERVALEQQRKNRRNGVFVLAGFVLVFSLFVTALLAMDAAEQQKVRADQLVAQAQSTRLMAAADRSQDSQYDASLLLNLEALRAASTLDAQAGLLRRFNSHPRLSTFLAGHKSPVNGVAFSPDGKRLASASKDETVIVWDLESRKPLGTLEGRRGEVWSVAFSPDGKRLATASQDQTVILWDLESRKPLATLEAHGMRVLSVVFSPDGNRLASASADKTVIVWDLERRQPLATLKGHESEVSGVAFSADGKHLASASQDATVILWNLESQMPLAATLKGHKEGVTSVAFSPDGKRLASASLDTTVILWDLESRRPLATLKGHKQSVSSVAFSPDGKQLASGGSDNTVILWHANGIALTTLEGHRDEVEGIAFSPDGKQLASAGRDNAVILWAADGRKLVAELEGRGQSSVTFSPDGKRLAAASGDNAVVWDLARRQSPITFEGHARQVYGVAFSPDGKRLASASRDETVKLWDPNNPNMVLTTLEGKMSAVNSVAFSPDGKQLASANADQTVILWDLDSGKPTLLKGHADEVKSVSFSPDGKRLASASSDKTVIVWDLHSRKPLTTFNRSNSSAWTDVASVTFHPDGKRLASLSLEGTVILWDLGIGKTPVELPAHYGAVTSVVFSPDGQRLASAGRDKTVILWDLESRTPLARLEGHEGEVESIAFSPDGRQLASTGRDSTVILWDLGLDSLKTEACRTANRNLTCQEWRQHIGPDIAYRKTCEALPAPQTCD